MWPLSPFNQQGKPNNSTNLIQKQLKVFLVSINEYREYSHFYTLDALLSCAEKSHLKF